MCKAESYLNEFDRLAREIQSESSRLSNLISKYDRELSVIYHEIELTKADLYTGWKLFEKQQKLLRKRRVVKNELDYYKSIKMSLNVEKIYTDTQKSKSNLSRLKKKHSKYTDGWNVKLEEAL